MWSSLAQWNLDLLQHENIVMNIFAANAGIDHRKSDIVWWGRITVSHDDVIKWKDFPRYWPFVPVPVNSPHKGQWRGALMFSLICVWINGSVNNREAGDLRRYRAHYDVIVMKKEMSTVSVWCRSRPWGGGSRQGRHFNPFITLTSYWPRWRLKSPASPVFTQPFIRA